MSSEMAGGGSETSGVTKEEWIDDDDRSIIGFVDLVRVCVLYLVLRLISLNISLKVWFTGLGEKGIRRITLGCKVCSDTNECMCCFDNLHTHKQTKPPHTNGQLFVASD
jgi:hypothetical protein